MSVRLDRLADVATVMINHDPDVHTESNESPLNQLIGCDNRRITVNEMRVWLDVDVDALETIMASLGYRKVCWMGTWDAH